MLQYVIKVINKNDPELLKVKDEIASIEKAKSVMLDAMVGDLNQIKNELEKVKATAKSEGEKYRGEDGKLINSDIKMTLAELKEQKTSVRVIDGVKFYNQMEHAIEYTPMEFFTQSAEYQVMQESDRVGDVKKNFASVLEYFGEDEKMTSTDFFDTMSTFLQSFDTARDFFERQEANRIKEEKRLAAMKEKEAKKLAAKLAKAKESGDPRRAEKSIAQNDKDVIIIDNSNESGGWTGVAAMVATAARKKQESKDDGSKSSNPMGMGGIAAAAAAAALKKKNNTEEPPSNPIGMGGIAAAAAAAALKKKNNTEEPPSNPMGMGGIAAAAAAAALKKKNITEEPPSNPIGIGGIAAAAAAAALKRKSIAETEDTGVKHSCSCEEEDDEMVKIATAAEERRGLVDISEEISTVSDLSQQVHELEDVPPISRFVRPVPKRANPDSMNFITSDSNCVTVLGKTVSTPPPIYPEESNAETVETKQSVIKSKGRQTFNSTVLRPKQPTHNSTADRGGIAAAAAQAAMKRNQQQRNSLSEQKDDSDITSHGTEEAPPQTFNPLAGGGIAAAAAQAAIKRNMKKVSMNYHTSKSPHTSNDSRDDDFTGTKINNISAIATAAANAALLRTKRFSQTNSMFDDDSIATQSKSDIDGTIIENMLNEETKM